LAAKIATDIETYVGGSTELVDTVKFALVAPAATVTLAGTVANAVLPLERVTTAPPAGAGALRVTVPVEVFPAATLVGLRLTEERVVAGGGGFTRRLMDLVASSTAAETVTTVVAVTALVDTVKFALAAPAGTVTLAGTAATAELLLERVTATPPVGAAVSSVTVAVEVLPPTTLVGLRLREERGECRIRPVGLQDPAPSVLLNTPTPVPAYRVVGVAGSIARTPTSGLGKARSVKPELAALQDAPPSVLLYTPEGVPA
jgi:hypothetical protein